MCSVALFGLNCDAIILQESKLMMLLYLYVDLKSNRSLHLFLFLGILSAHVNPKREHAVVAHLYSAL